VWILFDLYPTVNENILKAFDFVLCNIDRSGYFNLAFFLTLIVLIDNDYNGEFV